MALKTSCFGFVFPAGDEQVKKQFTRGTEETVCADAGTDTANAANPTTRSSTRLVAKVFISL